MTGDMRDEVDAAVARGHELQAGRPQREITVEVTVADRGQLTREKWTADLDDPGEIEGLEREVTGKIRRSTGG